MAAAFSAVAADYESFYSTPADMADSEVIFRHARRLFRRGLPGMMIDLGCGPGIALSWNVAPPDAYLGIDVAEGMVEEARRRWPPYTFLHGDHHAIQPSSATFILGGFGPFQYVSPYERSDFAKHVVDGLVPGGRFLLMARPTPTPDRLAHIGHPGHAITALRLKAQFLAAGADHVRVRGHRRYISGTSRGQVFRLRAERLFPLQPDRAEWLVVEGRRPGGWYTRYPR